MIRHCVVCKLINIVPLNSPIPASCNACVSHIRYLFICSEAVSHHDAVANNAIKTNNYNGKATLTEL